jgi:hypothetical protein
MDVYITVNDFADIKHNFLYKNIGDGNFELVNSAPSIDGGKAFGAAWLDMNNDGYLDLTVSNNGGSDFRLNHLYLNNGDETFTDQVEDAATTTPLRDFCSTVSDYNNDGYPDIFTPSYSTTKVHGLYKNNGGNNNWVSLRLEGVQSNRSAIGARLYCYTNGTMQTREVSSTSGQYTGSTLVQTFGIGTASSIDSIAIYWPSGSHQVILNPETNQIHQITEASMMNNETDILSFSLAEQTGTADIDYTGHTVMVQVANGSNMAALTPEINVSEGAIISPASGETVDFSNGSVNYTVTAQNGLDTQIWVITVTEDPVGINEYTNNSVIKIYPNPASTAGNVYISTSINGVYELNVMNYLGQKIKTLNIDLESGESKLLKLGELEQGIYFIYMQNMGERLVHKLVITK